MENLNVALTFDEWRIQLSPTRLAECDLTAISMVNDLVDLYVTEPVARFNGVSIPMRSYRFNSLVEIRKQFAGEDVALYMLTSEEVSTPEGIVTRWIVRYSTY